MTSGRMNSISPGRVSGKLPIDSLCCGGLANLAGVIGG